MKLSDEFWRNARGVLIGTGLTAAFASVTAQNIAVGASGFIIGGVGFMALTFAVATLGCAYFAIEALATSRMTLSPQ